MLWSVAVRVAVYYLLCLVASHLHQLSVSGYVGYLQVESHSTLLGALKVARTSQFEVCLGYAETVVCLTHDVESLLGFL